MGFMNYDRLAVAIVKQGLIDYENVLRDNSENNVAKAAKAEKIKNDLTSPFCRQLINCDVEIMLNEIDRRARDGRERIFKWGEQA